MGIFLTKRKGIFVITEKEGGRFIARISTRTTNERKAEKKMLEYIKNRDEFLKNKEKVLCSQLKEDYLELCVPPIKAQRTYESIGEAFNQFIKHAGDKYIYEYTNRDIDKFLSKKIKETSVHTAHRIRRTLRPAFHQAIRWGLIKTNPWIDSLKISLPEPDPVIIPKEDFVKLIEHAYNEVFRDFMIYDSHSGLREKELMRLKPEHNYIDKRIIKVYSTAANPTKDKESRNVEMHSKIIPIVEKYKHQEYLFMNPNTGKRFTKNALLYAMRKTCEAAGTQRYNIQDLRSTYGMTLINQDVPLKWISQQLGHSGLAVTERFYAKYLTHEYKGMVEKIDL